MYIMLVLFWILLNGKLTVEILVLGLIISFFITKFMIKHLDYNVKLERKILKNLPKFLSFGLLMLKEIFIANIMVMKGIIFLDKSEPSSLVKFDMGLHSEFTQVMLANCITITPGTITVKVKDNFFIVHGLSKTFTEDITESKIFKKIKELEAIINE